MLNDHGPCGKDCWHGWWGWHWDECWMDFGVHYGLDDMFLLLLGWIFELSVGVYP